MSQQEQKSGMIYKVLTFVFLLAVADAIFMWLNTKSELTGLLAEKESQRVELQANLDKLMTEHSQLKAENTELAGTLTEKDSVIQAKATEIENALKYKWSYFKIKKQFEELQTVSDGYVKQIDELKAANQQLTDENTMVKGQYAAEQEKTSTLTKIKNALTDQVDKASVVKTFAVSAAGVRVKSSGKERMTDKSRRLNKIKVCFTLVENVIAKAGSRDVYIRIAGPDNKILAKGMGDDFAFTYKGEKLQYSIMKTVDYNNESITLCGYWDKADQELAAGEYKVEVYEGGNVIGHANFNLR